MAKQIGTVTTIVDTAIKAVGADGNVRTLAQGDAVFQGDTIETGKRAYVKITLSDGTLFQLGPLSKASLDKFNYQPDAQHGELESSVFIGVFRFISGKIGGDERGQHTTIKTPAATIGIRGSELDIAVDEQGNMTLLHISGLVDVTPVVGLPFSVYLAGTRVELSLHDAPVVSLADSAFISQFRAYLLPLNAHKTEDESLLRANSVHQKEPSPTENGEETNTEQQESLGRQHFSNLADHALLTVGSSADSATTTAARLAHLSSSMGRNDGQEENVLLPPLPFGLSQGNTSNDVLFKSPLTTDDGDTNRFTEDHAILTPVLFTEPQLIRADTEILQGQNGTVFNNQDGSFTYVPNVGFWGEDSFGYRFSPFEAFTIVSVTIARPQVDMPLVQADDVVPIRTNAGGTLLVQTDGTVDYIPPVNFHGTDSFSYLPAGQNTPITIELNVEAMNDAPIAVRDDYTEILNPNLLTVAEDSVLTIPADVLLANDIEVDKIDGDGLSIYAVSPTDGIIPTQGTVVLNPDNSVSFQPTANFNGETIFTYVVQDSDGVRSSSTVKVAVTPVNDAPLVGNDVLNGAGQNPVTIPIAQLLSNDSDIEKQVLILIAVENPENGSVVLNPNGTITFTPAPNFTGGQFDYLVSDGQAENAVSRGTVIIVLDGSGVPILPIDDNNQPPITNNLAPIANADGVFQMGTEDTIVLLGASLLLNDIDPNGDLLSISSVSSGAGGTARLDAQGNITFTRSADFTGIGSFSYTISDGRGGTASATVTVQGEVEPLNLPPIAVNDAFITPENTALSINPATLLQNDRDPEQAVLNITALGGATHGTVTQTADGTIIFTPVTDFVGIAQFSYNVSDGVNNTTATVQIQVQPLPDTQPQAVSDSFITNHNQPLNISSAQLLANDIPAQATDILQIQNVINPQQGTVTLNSDGTVTFTPTQDFVGTASFDYVLSNQQGQLSSTTVTINVLPNQPPIAQDDADPTTNSVGFNQSLLLTAATLLANDSDPDNDPLTITQVDSRSQAQGTVTLTTDGNVLYTPAPDFSGTDQFTYTISDGHGGTASATVSVFVENAPPVAVDDLDPSVLSTPKNQAITIPVATLLSNDSDPNNDPLSLVAVGEAVNGQVAFTLDGAVIFTPDVNFVGTAGFQYSISDGKGAFDTAQVAITVVDANSPPVANPDTLSAGFNQTVFIPVADLLANDTDPDATDILSITELIDDPSNGVTAKLLNNEIQLFVDTLSNNQFDSISFKYILSDGQGNQSETTVTVEADNVIKGTANADNLAGTNADDIILGLGGNDTFQATTGNDILLGGEGDDLFLFDPSQVENAILKGESGQDTLQLTGSTSLDLLQNSSLPSGEGFQLSGIDTIDIRDSSGGNTQLRLSAQDVLDISDNGRLLIEGNTQSFVVSNDGWINAGVETLGTATYNRYTANGAELWVNTDIGGQFIF
ncbi:hypothetical protein BegalDRAFT_1216 [Beggiatoa alba B18LD]|uniref:Tandem-95 repeat protein n=1 Tax=Beggiatoa alba B18LD TaxID=395493 RepID=I3CES3_9GAMM|nr:cadherin-like domain-containing protein [Beggiatoa alba]EIJ42116.1 hypothetical protein BegalDRAFT_1216 [Beggiatoa alba B18LD]